MKEVHKVTGGSYGGIYVDEEFVSLLESVFGIEAVKKFRISFPAQWLRLMNDFEMKKRGKRAFEGNYTRITHSSRLDQISHRLQTFRSRC